MTSYLPTKKLKGGPALWHGKLRSHLQCWHPMWVLVQGPAASLLLKRPADALGKQLVVAQMFRSPALMLEI